MFKNKIKRKKREIIINLEFLESRVAILEKGNLENFFIERAEEDRLVGSIFKGKIQNIEDGLQAAFVDIGREKNAFIHYWDMVPEDTARIANADGGRPRKSRRGRRRKQKKYRPGEMKKKFPVGSEILVQVTKDAIGTKGPRVTTNLSIPGRYLVMIPGCKLKGISRKIESSKERNRLKKIMSHLSIPENVGMIVRTAGYGTKKTSFKRDVETLLEVWKDINKKKDGVKAPCRLYQEPDLAERVVRDSLTEDIDRIFIDSREEYDHIRNMVYKFSHRTRNKIQLYDGHKPIFEYFGIEDQISAIFERRVNLKSGGYLIFDETEALIAIDVNTGSHKKGQNQKETIFQVNLEAATAVARQLRLRNVGGLIIVDFIDMKSKKHQNAVLKTLKEELKKDRGRTNVLPISRLGLLEMTRQRVEESVQESTRTNCEYCHGHGKVKSVISMSVEIQRKVSALLRDEGKSHDLKITVNPKVLERFRREDEQLLLNLEKKFDGHLTFVADPMMHMEDFTIVNEKKNRTLYYTPNKE